MSEVENLVQFRRRGHELAQEAIFATRRGDYEEAASWWKALRSLLTRLRSDGEIDLARYVQDGAESAAQSLKGHEKLIRQNFLKEMGAEYRPPPLEPEYKRFGRDKAGRRPKKRTSAKRRAPSPLDVRASSRAKTGDVRRLSAEALWKMETSRNAATSAAAKKELRRRKRGQ